MMKVKLLASAIVIAIMMGGGCAKQSDEVETKEWAFQMEKVWEIEKAGDDSLLRPAEPRVADDGTLYFHDFERHLSYIIDNDGKLVNTFAGRGTGEGEVQFYINCFPAGDNVAVCAPDKILFFTKTGQFVKAVPNNLFVRFPLAFKNENEYWVGPGALGDSPSDSAEVIYINSNTGEETTIYKFARSDEEKKPTGGGVVIGLTPQLKMGYDKISDRIYFGKNSDTTIYSMPAGGGQIESFSFFAARHPVSEKEKLDHFSKFDIPEEALVPMIGALPDHMAYYGRIEVINGMVYLFSSDGLLGPHTGQFVNVYSPDGKHLYYGRIQVEEGWHIFTNPDNLQLGDGFVYVVQENDAGDKKIVKYSIALPE